MGALEAQGPCEIGGAMKAIRVHTFGGPEVLHVDDGPDRTRGRGQVVVRVRAAGVNPVDTYVRSGNYAMLPTLPYIPGNDCAGVIETVGEGVTRFKKGDRVYVVRTTTQLRSEEHTSELQSLAYLVCRLLLEKKKTRSATDLVHR